MHKNMTDKCLCSSWFRYEERAADSSRWDQNVGWSDPEEAEEWVLMDNKWTDTVYSFVLLTWITLINHLSTDIEPKKGEEDAKYVPINVRMQRTQVDSLIFAFMLKLKLQ